MPGMSRSSHSTIRTMPIDAHVLANHAKVFTTQALATETTPALLSQRLMLSSTIQSLRLRMFEMNDGMAIELTGADGEKWECLGAAWAPNSDIDGWSIPQEDSHMRERHSDRELFNIEYLCRPFYDRPWYQVPGHSMSGLPLSSGETIEGIDYE